MDLVVDADYKHFCIGDSVNLGLDFLEIWNGVEGRDVLEFVFSSSSHGECGQSSCRQEGKTVKLGLVKAGF